MLKNIVVDQKYNRSEVAELVGCKWANVMEASKPRKGKDGSVTPARLKGELTQVGNQQVWLFTGQQILDWRESVETRKSATPQVKINLVDESDREELKKLLAGTKFAF